jgi:hypothetical protein
MIHTYIHLNTRIQSFCVSVCVWEYNKDEAYAYIHTQSEYTKDAEYVKCIHTYTHTYIHTQSEDTRGAKYVESFKLKLAGRYARVCVICVPAYIYIYIYILIYIHIHTNVFGKIRIDFDRKVCIWNM